MANPTITVTRKDDGIAEYKFTHGVKEITGKGFWDDVTPWQGGTYNASFWLFKSFFDSLRIGTLSNPNPIPGRTDIVIHDGNSTNSTEGCLVDSSGFVDDVYSYLRDNNLAPGSFEIYSNRLKGDRYNSAYQPVEVKVEGDFSYDVELSLYNGKSTYKEGEDVLLDIVLTGSGAANGLSKDLWLHLNFDGSGDFGLDLQPGRRLGTPPSKATENLGIKNDNQWVKLSAGQQKVTIALSSIFDDLKEDTETFNVTIDDYAIRRDRSLFRGDKFYKSGGSFPIGSNNDQVSFSLEDQREILDEITESGGQGNFTFTAPFAPEQIIQGQFTSFTIPDRLIVQDGGTTLLDTGSVRVTGLPINFTIPETSNGNVTITVEAPLFNTLWNFSLQSVGLVGNRSTPKRVLKLNAPLKLSSPSADSRGNSNVFKLPRTANSLKRNVIKPDLIINTFTESILTEGTVNDTAQGTGFSISRNGDLRKVEEIGWRVKPIGKNSISAADFDSNSFPQGTLRFFKDYQESKIVYFEKLDTRSIPRNILNSLGSIDDYWGLKKDGIAEQQETWTIELFNPKTGRAIPAKFNGNKVFSVLDDFYFVEPREGTNNSDSLSGNALPNIIFGLAGNDIINGKDNDDRLYGGNGNDVIDAGQNDDIIDGGFGNDRINGGVGNDTVHITRPQSLVSLSPQSSGRLILEDMSAVPLGKDILIAVETIEFSDGVLKLNSVGTPANDLLVGSGNGERLNGKAGNDQIFGLAGDDVLTGGSGDDSLVGGVGNDKLRSGQGKDSFVFDTGAPFNVKRLGVDRLLDFRSNEDKIVLDVTTFTELGQQVSIESVFDVRAAGESNALITYIQSSGSLYYNENGTTTGFGNGGLFALLNKSTFANGALTASDFDVKA